MLEEDRPHILIRQAEHGLIVAGDVRDDEVRVGATTGRYRHPCTMMMVILRKAVPKASDVTTSRSRLAP